jgi:SOS-response transcriptional repressor LexA
MELARRVSAHRAKSGKPIVRQQSINQLEVGEVTSPRYLHDLAAVLEVNVNWLIGDDDVDPISNNISRVPLISWVQAGDLADAADPYYAGDAEDWVPIAHRHDNFIALRVRGDSMNKIAPDGSVIIVDLNERNGVDGKHYVFRHDGQATFKTYRSGPPIKLEPQSFDPGFNDIYPEDGAEIVGLVIRKTEEI